MVSVYIINKFNIINIKLVILLYNNIINVLMFNTKCK